MGQVQSMLGQSFFIPNPTLTEHNLPDQAGRVHIVTGGYTGVGKELAKILYSRNGTVYVAGRSTDKGNKAIADIKRACPDSSGKVEFLLVDLADLRSVGKAAQDFMAKENRLDVLHNNAGVMFVPQGNKNAHGHEQQMGVNCLGPFLLAQSLLPILQRTAATSTPGSVRVTWAGSIACQLVAPKHGIEIANDEPKDLDTYTNYAQSKVGNFYLSTEFARRYGKTGIISASFNPGNLLSELQRYMPWWQQFLLKSGLYPPKMGALTELYAACSTDISMANNGAYVMPWGRIGTDQMRADVLAGSKAKAEGGKGVAAEFWEWCEKETSPYALK